MSDKKIECKILLVDDMEMNLIILAEIIKSMGHVPLSATSAKDALEILKNDLPQLILLDVSMPDMTGLEFCELLKEDVYTREIPVIFISAMDSQDDLSKAFEIGAVDYIFKPFDPNDVKVRVNTHLKLYTMQKELEETNRELNRVIKQQMAGEMENQKKFLKMFAEMISSRDSEATHDYGDEAYIARMLTQAMMFSDEFEDEISEHFIAEMELAASLHDIGMIKVPEEIVLKKDVLDENQRNIMKKHVDYGCEAVLQCVNGNSGGLFAYSETITDVIKYHHERYDGSGYPRGLKGEEIPLSARIMAVVDTFDALANGRCYKTAYSLEETFRILEEGADVLYDGRIVSILKKIQRQFANKKIN